VGNIFKSLNISSFSGMCVRKIMLCKINGEIFEKIEKSTAKIHTEFQMSIFNFVELILKKL
jgi:hypothetical protein